MKKLLLTLVGVICSLGMWAAAITPVFKDFTGLGTNVVYVASHTNITQENTTAIMASVAASDKWLTGYNNEAWSGDNISERTLGINPDTDETMSGKLIGGRMKNASENESQRSYWFYVTGVTAVYIYHEANSSRSATVNVYEDGNDEAVFSATTSDKTIKATGLYTNKKYIVKVNGAGSDVYFYAAKFFGTASTKEASSFGITSSNNLYLNVNDQSTINTEKNAGTVTFKSNDTNIATVSNTGVITAVGGGTTTISVVDPGSSTVDGRTLSVTVNTLYSVDQTAKSFKFDNAGYFLANDGKWYFKNGWSISTNQGFQYAALNCNELSNNGFKVSAGKTYTINVPEGVTIRSAKVTMRSNYGSDKTAANWGTIFGQDLSSEALPFSSENAVTKEFSITSETPMTFTPGGNQCQMYIELSTEALGQDSDLALSSSEATVAKDKSISITFTSSSTGEVATESDKETVAKAVVDGNNIVITGIAAGTATITVSQAKDNTYAAGKKTITVTVTDPVASSSIFEAVVGSKALNVATGTTQEITSDYATVTDGCSMTAVNNHKDNNDFISAQNKVYFFALKASATFFTVNLKDALQAGDVITATMSATGRGLKFATADTYSTDYPGEASATTAFSYTVTEEDGICGETTFNIFRATGNATYFKDFTISRPATVASPTLNASGYATFSSEYGVQIKGAKAYAAKLNTAGNKLECKEIEGGKVPAGVGVLLFGEANAEVTASYCADAPAVTGNELKATTLADGSLAPVESCLILSGDTFVRGTGTAYKANKAYLPYADANNAKAFTIVFGETTGINAVEAPAAAKAVKTVKNGKLVISVNGVEYNAVGAQIK